MSARGVCGTASVCEVGYFGIRFLYLGSGFKNKVTLQHNDAFLRFFTDVIASHIHLYGDCSHERA